MQIIWAAILGGAVIFLIIALTQKSPVSGEQSWTANYIILGLVAVVVAVAYQFAVNWVEGAQRRTVVQAGATPQAWYNAYQTCLIVGLAFLEGGAFLMLVIYWMEPLWGSLLIAIGFMGFMATQFPTQPGIERWIKEQQEKLKEPSGR